MSSLGESIYSGASSLGRFKATISLWAAVAFFVVCIGLAWYCFSYRGVFNRTVTAEQLADASTTCTQKVRTTLTGTADSAARVATTTTLYDCHVPLRYTLPDGSVHQCTVDTESGNNYANKAATANSAKMEVYYSDNNPNECKLHSDNIFVWGYVALSVGTLALAGAGLNYYMVSNYKFMAAGEGASTVAQMFRR